MKMKSAVSFPVKISRRCTGPAITFTLWKCQKSCNQREEELEEEEEEEEQEGGGGEGRR
jgi:hypothetical protein